MLIQLQRLDPTTNENLGGLYINVDHVSAVYYDRPSRQSRIVMSNGIEYIPAQSMSEVLDAICEAKMNRKRGS